MKEPERRAVMANRFQILAADEREVEEIDESNAEETDENDEKLHMSSDGPWIKFNPVTTVAELSKLGEKVVEILQHKDYRNREIEIPIASSFIAERLNGQWHCRLCVGLRDWKRLHPILTKTLLQTFFKNHLLEDPESPMVEDNSKKLKVTVPPHCSFPTNCSNKKCHKVHSKIACAVQVENRRGSPAAPCNWAAVEELLLYPRPQNIKTTPVVMVSVKDQQRDWLVCPNPCWTDAKNLPHTNLEAVVDEKF